MTYFKTLRRVMAAIITVAIIALVAGLSNAPHPRSAFAATTTQTLTPVADAYVSSSSPGSNHGTGYEIDVDGSPVKVSYFTFDLSSLSGTVISAQFTITSSWDGSANGGDIQTVSDTSWTESTLTYTNRPATSGTSVGNLGAVNPYQTVSADVTSGVSSGGLVGLAIVSTNSDQVAYTHGKARRPQRSPSRSAFQHQLQLAPGRRPRLEREPQPRRRRQLPRRLVLQRAPRQERQPERRRQPRQ